MDDLLDKLPPFEPTWPPEAIKAWFDALVKILDIIKAAGPAERPICAKVQPGGEDKTTYRHVGEAEVERWVRRIDSGESVYKIARETGRAQTTVRARVAEYRRLLASADEP